MLLNQKNISEWMKAFGQICPEKPTIPNEAIRVLRVKLIFEELLELAAASSVSIILDGNELNKHKDRITFGDNGENPNLVEIMDATGDLDVVVTGTGVACGIDMEPLHTEILRSNQSKFWTQEQINGISNKNDFLISGKDDQWVVKRRDGKIMKSPTFSPPNLQLLLTLSENK